METDRLEISKETVIDILRNRDRIKMQIQDKMYQINRDVRNVNELIEVVSLRSEPISDMPKGRGGPSDLTAVYLDYQKELDNRRKEYKHILYALIRKEECVERVWQCYLVLSEPYFSILTNMYVNNQKYETAEMESGFSRQVFEKHRGHGIALILKLYYSEKSISELLDFSERAEKSRMKVKNPTVFNLESYQISLEDYLTTFKD